MNYSIWVTTQCNLCCTYCYEGSEKTELLLGQDMADEIIDYIARRERESQEIELDITYHGGEPFLNFDIIKYISLSLKEKIPNKRIYFSAATNGTIVSSELLKFVNENQFEISISIDGDQKTHDLYRTTATGAGTHARVVKNIKEYLALFPKMRARMTYNDNTVNDLANNILYLIKLGFQCIVPIQDFDGKNWSEANRDTLLVQIEKAKSFADIYGVDIGICEPLDVSTKKVCDGGTSTINIYPDGKLYPCMIGAGIPEYEIGDVIAGINQNKLAIILEKSNDNITECIGCSFYDFCDNTRCRIINKVIRGDYCLPSGVVCAINNVRYQVSGTKKV